MKKLASILIALTLILSMFTGFSVFAAKEGYVTFFDADGNMISEITTERTISAEIGFYPQGNTTANVIVAHYNHGGAMTGFYVADTISATASDEPVTANIEEIDVSDATDGAVKVFVWNSFDSISPVSNCSGEITRPEFKLELEDGVVLKNTELYVPGAYAQIPYGVVLSEGAETLSLSVTSVNDSQSGIVAGETDKLTSLDVHMEGVSKDNKTPIIITLYDVAAKGLNLGNLALYHVENGETVQMTQVSSLEEVTAHNSFYYDALEGTLTLALATFSEIAVVEDTEKAWKGEFDYSWYLNRTGDTYKIANADQFAAFGAIVGGMELPQGILQDTFEGKTVTLVSDINIGDKETENNPDIIFYPIGYYNSTGKYERTNDTTVTSNVSSFKGTFDGNGHTISNFYQNTWEMFGDYNDGYSAGSNYYKDAMGLFGYVNGGTVKNLIVENFSSDGEFTPTGVVAAYAVNSTFENIALVNCTPRVYNTGNGGIVGIGGNSDDPDSYKLTFNNITIDNTNKITALWGSYDVACGGLVGMFRGAGHVYMTNCHVGALLDVFNDVCGNYQYYRYRYAGMLIGTNKNMITENGKTVPETDKIHAEKCTVHFGDWNNYWYCELVANSLASYTHDHQFSRLTRIDSIDVENMTVTVNGVKSAIPSTGRQNYVVIDTSEVDENGKVIYSSENATCYHFVDGKVWKHEDAGYEDFDLDGDGNLDDYKEDRHHYYLPFNQVMTGYGWGVEHIPVDKNNCDLKGVEILDRDVADSVVKFEEAATAADSYTTGATVTVGELFNEVENSGVKIDVDNVQVTVSPVGTDSTASATYVANTDDWTHGTLTFDGTGAATITITDYYYCTPTTITVNITERQPEEKFDLVFENTDSYLYRVGNDNTTPVKLSSLFKAKDGVEISTVEVTVEPVDGTVASGTYTPNATWTNGTIDFNGTGVVKVSITDNNYCIPTELYLEVVDAVNATGTTSATANNVVLLNDCGLSSLTISGRYTFYGNGFTATYTGNGQYLNNGLKQGIITVSENGTLDNLRIKASIYPSAYLYYGSTLLGDYVQGGPSSVEGDKTRYHYQLSAIAASGNATISNCYVYGGRNNVFVNTGDVTIKDSILECGTVANVQIQSNASHTITFENVTTIQYQVNPTIGDTSKVMLGAGVLVGPETTENPTIVLNGDFKQYNWVNADDAGAVSDTKITKAIIQGALDATAYNHTINSKTASNLGIIYMNEYPAYVTNNTILPYTLDTIKMTMSGNSVKGQAYSLQNATADQIYSVYANADKSTENGVYEPQFRYSTDLGGQYIEKDSGDEHCYREGDTIHVMFPSGDTKELDLAAFVDITKYTGQNLNLAIACKDESGNSVAVTDGKISLSDAGEYTVTYTVTDALFYDKDGKTFTDSKEYSWDVTVRVSLKDTAIPDAYFEFDATKQKMGYYKPTLGDVKQYLPFLAGLKIYDYNGQTAYLRFDGDADYNKVASVTITNYSSNEAYVEVILTDGGVINTKFLARADSGGGSTYTGKIKTSNNTIYFVSDSGTSNKDSTTTAAYWYVDYYKFTGNNGVAIQSPQQTFNSTGSSASTPSGSFNTTITYTVTYEANEGNCGQTTGYATSKSAAVTLPTPTRSGYLFAGWFTAASGGTKIGDAGASYTPSSNITLYAQWGKPCTVTYNANGGTCEIASEKYTGTALTLPTPTRDGYWFIGWYDAAEGGNKIGEAGKSYNPTGEITLYAHWQEAIEYTVAYDANGGTCGTASATYQGTALTLPTPTQTGYKFLGWYTAATGGTRIGDAGADYIPSANITLYAQWEINSYTITVTTSNATVKVNGTTVSSNSTVSILYGAQVTVEVTYSQTDSQSTTIKGTDGTTYTSPFNMPAQNVTINATSSEPSSGNCVIPGTLITLADGSQKAVEDLTADDMLLVWNLETGAYDVAPIVFVDSESENEYEVINLYFDNGTDVGVIYEHGFFDLDLGKYVYIDAENAKDYIGHTFVTQDDISGNTWSTAKLENVVIENKVTRAYSPVTFEHLCYYTNGVLSMPGGIEGLFNIFDVDTTVMAYDKVKMEKDIETYGLFTFEDFEGVVSEIGYQAFNGDILKVAIGKGILTWEDIEYLAARYMPLVPEK